MLWYATLRFERHGSGPENASFTWVWYGGEILQYRLLGPASPFTVVTSGVPSPENWMSTGPPEGVSTLPITPQSLNTSWPTLNPPCSRNAWGSRAFTDPSTPL